MGASVGPVRQTQMEPALTAICIGGKIRYALKVAPQKLNGPGLIELWRIFNDRRNDLERIYSFRGHECAREAACRNQGRAYPVSPPSPARSGEIAPADDLRLRKD